jgi:NDP-sugar pyrophosphorylase family protein
LIEQKQNVNVFPIREYWLDIGRIEDFKRANLEFKGGNLYDS